VARAVVNDVGVLSVAAPLVATVPVTTTTAPQQQPLVEAIATPDTGAPVISNSNSSNSDNNGTSDVIPLVHVSPMVVEDGDDTPQAQLQQQQRDPGIKLTIVRKDKEIGRDNPWTIWHQGRLVTRLGNDAQFAIYNVRRGNVIDLQVRTTVCH